MGRPLTSDDGAFGCFLIAGVISLVLGAVNITVSDPNTLAALGFFIAIPLTMLALLLMALALLYTIFVHHHKLLMLLSAITLLFLIEMAGEYGPAFFYNATPVIYGVATIALSLFWFVRASNTT